MNKEFLSKLLEVSVRHLKPKEKVIERNFRVVSYSDNPSLFDLAPYAMQILQQINLPCSSFSGEILETYQRLTAEMTFEGPAILVLSRNDPTVKFAQKLPRVPSFLPELTLPSEYYPVSVVISPKFVLSLDKRDYFASLFFRHAKDKSLSLEAIFPTEDLIFEKKEISEFPKLKASEFLKEVLNAHSDLQCIFHDRFTLTYSDEKVELSLRFFEPPMQVIPRILKSSSFRELLPDPQITDLLNLFTSRFGVGYCRYEGRAKRISLELEFDNPGIYVLLKLKLAR